MTARSEADADAHAAALGADYEWVYVGRAPKDRQSDGDEHWCVFYKHRRQPKCEHCNDSGYTRQRFDTPDEFCTKCDAAVRLGMARPSPLTAPRGSVGR